VSAPRRRRGFTPLRDLPALLWLLAVLGVALVHREVAAPRWLLFHLLLLGAVTHSIVVWSQHFTDALLHARPGPATPRVRSARLALLNAGVLVVVVGASGGHWVPALVGAAAVAGAVVWHVAGLLLQLRRALGSRFAVSVRYYVAAGAVLPVGLTFGVLMVRGVGEGWHARLMVGHVVVNVLGWMALTVLGTLVTLWPTMLRTRIAAGAEVAARRALPVLLAGLAVVVVGCLAGLRPVTGLGLLGYAGGVAVLLRPFVGTARQKAPAHFATWSVLAAVCWFTGVVAVLAVGIAVAPSWMSAHELLDRFTPALAVGFGAQVLLGALSFLVPVSVGGNPSGTRAANIELDRGSAMRVVAVNLGVLVWLLPVPGTVRVAVSAVVLAALAAFVPLMFLGMRAARRARASATSRPAARPRGPLPPAAARPRGQLTGLAVAGLGAVVLAVAVGVAVDPSALAGGDRASADAGVTPTGRSTRVVVEAADMRFTPDTVRVPAGNRLVIDLRNTDGRQVHDLVLDSGADSGRLAPGGHTTLDVGVVGRSLEGWCSVVGHRQMGMVFHVRVTGAPPPASGHHTAMPGMGEPTTPGQTPAPDFRPADPRLPPVEPGRVHRRTFRISDVRREVAPGVVQTLWTYDGTVPGPVLHGRVGDRFVIHLVNDGTMSHSIDFHAGDVAPDAPMRTLAPGQSLTYRFTARHAGIWLYHCSTMPMSAHIANGMFGAVVIDPPGLRPVDEEYVVVQSELYLGADGGPVDADKVGAERPDLVVFNGYANQYDRHPLTARVGDRVRFWVLDAGPNRSSSFHVVGSQFDTVYAEGGYLLRPGDGLAGGSQVLQLGPAQGGFVELRPREPGHYPFVSHLMVDAERGAHGVLRVTR
jgi:nitrite reductase (NO-forming)